MSSERAAIVAFLEAEADYARYAEGKTESPTDKLYRMGQKDALLLAADAIKRGQFIGASA